jgi:MFS family permease
MPQVAHTLISKYDWRTSFLYLGIIAFVLIIVFAQLLRRAPEQGIASTGDANALKTSSPNVQTQGLSAGEALHTRAFWIVCLTSFLVGLVVQVVMVHIVAHTTDIGYTAATAATILSVVGFVSIFGKIFMGGLGDRIGNRNVMVIVCSLLALAFLWLMFAGELWTLYLFAAVFAAGYSGASATHSPQMAEFFGLRSHGIIFGLAQLVANVGGALGSFIAGYIFDTTGSYQWAFILCTLLSAFGLVLSIFLPARKRAQTEVRVRSIA